MLNKEIIMYYQTSISTESTVLGRVRKPSSHVLWDKFYSLPQGSGLKGVGECLFCEKDSLTNSTVVLFGLQEFMLELSGRFQQ